MFFYTHLFCVVSSRVPPCRRGYVALTAPSLLPSPLLSVSLPLASKLLQEIPRKCMVVAGSIPQPAGFAAICFSLCRGHHCQPVHHTGHGRRISPTSNVLNVGNVSSTGKGSQPVHGHPPHTPCVVNAGSQSLKQARGTSSTHPMCGEC
jgi:hypothetical protein